MEEYNKEKLLKDIVKRKPYLFWYVRDIESLSVDSIVEAILCRGDFDDFLELIKILGMENVAKTFFRQVSMKRTNYTTKTGNYFTLFFKKHLQHV